MTRCERGRVALPVALGGLALTLALVVLVAWGWTSGRLNAVICGGPCGPEAVAAPDSLLLDATADRPEPAPAPAGTLDAAAVKKAVEPLLDVDELGGSVGLAVMGVSGEPVLDIDAARAFVPASTTKLTTAFAVLNQMEPSSRFSTSTVLDAGRVVLVGGGDPYLASTPPKKKDRTRVDRADLRTLAGRTATALTERGVTSVSLGYDDSLFEGPDASPEWEDGYIPGQVVTPISALWADQGIRDGVRSSDPSASAAERFAGYLRDAGVKVEGDPEEVTAAETALDLAQVSSATLAQITDAMLVRSDNEAAEVLLRHVAIAAGEPASFAGGVAAVEQTLRDEQLPLVGFELHDGSGLSRDNRISPLTLAHLLSAASARASTAELLADLPVGGFSGTLQDRYTPASRASDGAGVVRAKTGTLTGVHSLAGYATDRRGVPIIFAIMVDETDDVSPLATQAALDDVAAALASCACSS